MNIAGGGEAEAAGEGRSHVARDIAEQIAGDDDFELRRVAHHLHQQVVNVLVRGFHLRIFDADQLEDALPKIVTKCERVRFVAHAHTFFVLAACEFKRVADDALDALARIEIFLRGYYVGSSILEEATHAYVEAFGIFPEHHEIDVLLCAILERGEAFIEEHAGARVDVEIELEAQAE